MDSKMRAISPAQLITLLFVSRLFTLLTFVPQSESVSGAESLLVIPIAAAGAMLLGIPYLWMQKRLGLGLPEAAWKVGKPFGASLDILFGLVCLAAAAHTISHYGLFMLSSIYVNAQPWIFTICMSIAIIYAAYLGLEAFSRMGTFVALLSAGVLLVIAGALIPQFKAVYLSNPLSAGTDAISGGAMRALASYADIFPFLLLGHRTGKPGGKPYVWWILLSAAAFELITAVTAAVLGEYAGVRQFPVYALAAAARLGSVGRMDLIYLFLWTFTAFLRAALFLYAACTCLRRLIRPLSLGWAAVACGAAAAAVVLASGGRDLSLWHTMGGQPLYFTIFLLLIIGFPLGAILFERKNKPQKEGKR